MDYDRIQQLFMDITGVGAEEFRWRQMVLNGRAFVRSRLNAGEDTLDTDGLFCCEYAAAACAAYEYACAETLHKRPVMSENGTVSIQTGKPEFAAAMKDLRESALETLSAAGLTKDRFAFKAV